MITARLGKCGLVIVLFQRVFFSLYLLRDFCENKGMKRYDEISPREVPLALHVCCGPCALEPILAFEQEGFKPTLFWANDNIWPRGEKLKRSETLCDFAEPRGYHVVFCEAQPWEDEVAPLARAVMTKACSREDRCRACYRTRLEASAKQAAALGFKHLATTLAVSPYQLQNVCAEELSAVSEKYGLIPVVRDFRPRYEEGKRRSIELGMYRQKYCGCRFSAIEAQDGRERARERKKARNKERKSS